MLSCRDRFSRADNWDAIIVLAQEWKHLVSGIPPVLWHRVRMLRSRAARPLVDRLRLPALRRQRPLRRLQPGQTAVSVPCVPSPDLADRGHAVPVRQHQAAADEVVSGDLPCQPGQDRAVCLGTQAPHRGELPHVLADAPQDHDGHGDARDPTPTVGDGASRRCLPWRRTLRRPARSRRRKQAALRCCGLAQ